MKNSKCFSFGCCELRANASSQVTVVIGTSMVSAWFSSCSHIVFVFNLDLDYQDQLFY
jgi:hypothetical protein